MTTQSKTQTNTNTNELPKFDQVIKIEIEVQSIHEKLLNELPEDYKHRAILAHAVIGSAAQNGGLNYIYNALCGFTNDVDFKVGDNVICTEIDKYERYDANIEAEDGSSLIHDINVHAQDYKPKWKARTVKIGECSVKSINLYASNKLEVEYKGWSRTYDVERGQDAEIVTTSVNHKNCTKVPVEVLAN
jgi:hypothetical protein